MSNTPTPETNFIESLNSRNPIELLTTIDDYQDFESSSIIIEPLTPDLSYNSSESSKLETQENEENYDYEIFKAEYYQNIENLKNKNQTYNFTDNGITEETPEDKIKKILDFKLPKNCTNEELTKFGITAIECLAYDYKNAKNKNDVNKILSRSWSILKVWFCIYMCIAIPAFCQKGWCCCCLGCKIFYPYETIDNAKKYYANNPPGILKQKKNNNNDNNIIKYEPTLFEYEAYENFESAIRNL